jgi:hypothetical protein
MVIVVRLARVTLLAIAAMVVSCIAASRPRRPDPWSG